MKALQSLAFIGIWILSILIMLPQDGYTASGSAENPRHPLAKASASDDRKSGIHDGNKILTILYNYGGIGDWTISQNRLESGIYPRGSGHSYFAEFSPVIGAEAKDIDGETIHIFSDGMVSSTMMDQAPEGYQYGFEPLPGYANPLQNTIAMSDQPETWPATWPNRPADWDGFWNGQYGKYSRADQESYFVMNDYFNDEFSWYPKIKEGWENKSGSVIISTRDTSDVAGAPDDTTLILTYDAGGFAGQPRIRNGLNGDRVILHDNVNRFYQIAAVLDDHSLRLRTLNQSVYSTYNRFSPGADTDINFTLVDGRTRGLGFEVETRGYQWSNVAAEDILIFTYWITNTSTHDYEKVVFGMYGDADVGDDGDQHDDDAWFDTQADIVYQYDHDFWSNAKGGFRPVYFGYRFLESPGDPEDGIDNDEDGMVDESQQDGIDNDGDWVAYEDLNGNGAWDITEPINDDVGTDGLGPDDNDYPGPDEDGTQGNGLPDVGEPNFEFTDNDESDQIGLTSFGAGPYPGIEIADDEITWNTRMNPGNFESITQTADLTFLYGSGYFSLAPEQSRKFSIAMVFGEDEDDIFRNSDIIQRIYDADYAFAKPPLKPNVTAVPGDKKVTLYWDNRAEHSNDHIYGKDFEGYRIYRATDPNFVDNREITDAFGNPTFYKPIAQFDLDNGLVGPHPEPYNGIMFNMGDDTGLQYTYTDENVDNGQTYYYAVTSYDKGYAEDFYERGIVPVDSLPPIPPSESSKTIKTDVIGEIERLDVNTIAVTPNAPAAGYQPPEHSDFDSTEIYGTGDIGIEFIDPMAVLPGNTYQIKFTDTKTDGVDNDGDWTGYTDSDGNGQWDAGEPLNDDVGTDGLAPADTEYTGPDDDGTQGNGLPDPGEPNVDTRDYVELLRRTTGYSVFNTTNPDSVYPIISNSTYLGGENFNPFVEGLQITVDNDSVVPDEANSSFVEGDCNWHVRGALYDHSTLPGIPYPIDYHVALYDEPVGKDLFDNEITYQIWEELTGDSVTTANINGILIVKQLPSESQQYQPSWQLNPESRFGRVQDIYVDAKNRIWVGTQTAGLGLYYEGNWTYFGLGTENFFPASNIRQVMQTINGELLFATANGLFSLSDTDEDMELGMYRPDGLSTNVTALAMDGLNRLWIGTNDGVKGYTQDMYRESLFGKTTLQLAPVEEDSLPVPDPNITTIYYDQNDNLWVGTRAGYTRRNFATEETDSVYIDGRRFNVFYEHDGTLYAGTNQGLFTYENNAFVADSLAGKNIRGLLTYNEALYATSDNALYEYDTTNDTIAVHTVSSDALTNNLTTSLTVTENNHLWIGNNTGIDRYEDGTWASFNPEPGDEYIFRVKKNFASRDSLVFTTQGATINPDSAKRNLSNIAVVPNPYVVTAKWEPQHFYTSGRGERKIDFINLPPKCTIRIFTMRGYLVKKIEHNTTINNGAASWDLTSRDGLDVSYGVYIYHVDAEGIGEHIGKFALIK